MKHNFWGFSTRGCSTGFWYGTVGTVGTVPGGTVGTVWGEHGRWNSILFLTATRVDCNSFFQFCEVGQAFCSCQMLSNSFWSFKRFRVTLWFQTFAFVFLLRLRSGMTVGSPEGSDRNRNAIESGESERKRLLLPMPHLQQQLKLASSTRAATMWRLQSPGHLKVRLCRTTDDKGQRDLIRRTSTLFDKDSATTCDDLCRSFLCTCDPPPQKFQSQSKLYVKMRSKECTMYNLYQFTGPSQPISLLHYSS